MSYRSNLQRHPRYVEFSDEFQQPHDEPHHPHHPAYQQAQSAQTLAAQSHAAQVLAAQALAAQAQRASHAAAHPHHGQRFDQQARHAAPHAQSAKHPAQHPHPQRPAFAQAPAKPNRKLTDYALVHAGRQVRLGRTAFWIAVLAVIGMSGWTLATGTYFAFRDDVIKGLISRQAEMQHAYEDRIAELRSRLDRVSSRQLLDQEQFEEKLEQISRRQTTLEQRAAALAIMPDLNSTGSTRPARGNNDGSRAGTQKTSSLGENWRVALKRDSRSAKGRNGMDAVLARMQESLDRVERKQVTVLNVLGDSYETRSRRMRGVLADLGNAAGKAQLPPATGGPYIPVNAAGESFEQHVRRVNVTRAHLEQLNRTLSAVPLRKPVEKMDFSSSFGVRLDPFLRAPALHTGLDMRGNPGDPVRATATGIVSFAGTNGGYGKMVEVDHGNGLATRYAHLSVIEAKVGQSVRIGQIVGRIGSTGRSTGPHLHYETRVDDKPIDPQKYLRAGAKL